MILAFSLTSLLLIIRPGFMAISSSGSIADLANKPTPSIGDPPFLLVFHFSNMKYGLGRYVLD